MPVLPEWKDYAVTETEAKALTPNKAAFTLLRFRAQTDHIIWHLIHCMVKITDTLISTKQLTVF